MRDGQVAQAHLRLERPARPDPDEGRPLGDRQDLGHDDLDVVRADAGRDDRHPLASISSGDRRELPVSALELDGFEARGDPGGSIGVTGEEDVLGQFAWTEFDVVLPFSGCGSRSCDPGVSTRLSAFGKTCPSLRWLLRWRETRPRIAPRSHERQAEWIVRGSRSAERGRRRGGPSGVPANVARRPAIRAASRRRDCSRRSSVTATDATEIASQRPESGGPGIDRQSAAAETGEPARAGARAIGSPGPGHVADRGWRLAAASADASGDRVARQDDPARVVDDDDRTVGRRLDAPDRVEGVVGLDQRELSSAAAAKDDAARSRCRRRA